MLRDYPLRRSSRYPAPTSRYPAEAPEALIVHVHAFIRRDSTRTRVHVLYEKYFTVASNLSPHFRG